MNNRTIWVDADACPKAVKAILFRAASRVSIKVILVANQPIPVPRSPYIRMVQVSSGFDVADHYIIAAVTAADLVISADIPLAAEAVAKGACVVSPRGERYDARNIRERLSMRDFMSGLRDSGIETGGQSTFSKVDNQHFANQLDRWLSS